MRLTRHVAIASFPLLVACAAAAQQGTTNEDHERADAAYLERLERAAAESARAPGPLDDLSVFIERAEQLVRDPNYRSASSERYRVQSDDPRLEIKAAVALLDSCADFVDERWSSRLELGPFGETSRVFLFYSFHKYNKLLGGDYSRRYARPKGHYGTVIDALAAHTDADQPGGFADTLVHEAAHQLVARRFFPGDAAPSPWLAEGLGTYFGFTYRDESGAFVEGDVGGKHAGLIRDERDGRAVDARAMIRHVRRALREGSDGGSVAGAIVDLTEPVQFYGGSPALHYGVSWLLIHAMLHGDDGTHVPGFLAYIERERQGEAGLTALLRATGLGAAELDTLVLRHIPTVKVH